MDSSDAKVLAELLKAKSFGSMLEHNSTLTFLNLSDNQINVSSNSLDQSSKDELTKHKPPQLTLNM